jgi:hypothetical protein
MKEIATIMTITVRASSGLPKNWLMGDSSSAYAKFINADRNSTANEANASGFFILSPLSIALGYANVLYLEVSLGKKS